ncbi:MAG: YeeE/YedE family protein [Gammaproteobacteria bacterium]|jgi:uncharacterized membrane protein YedE/YeeE|nr:YeeE/YedE family protein [Gammaproteobacteria bacterium]
MDWSPVYKVSALAFLIGIAFGAIANKTNFCTMGAVSDWINIGDKNRLRAWLLAIGTAMIATQALQTSGLIDLRQSIYLTTNFGWLGYLLGGGLFGVGMTLASGCGQRTLVRVGGGNLKSLIVMLFLGLTAYMTLRGLLALVRVNVIEATRIKLSVVDQGVGTLLASATGVENAAIFTLASTAILGGGAIVFAFASRSFRRSFNDVLAGIAIGLIIPAGWYVTGVIGFDDFEPVRFESHTFVAPTGEALQYLMTFTGSTISFGVSTVFGVILGSFVYAVVTRKFRFEYFVNLSDLIRHILGGILMGFGGVMALGCTIGQGITGISTLALGSLMALTSIVFGSALTMKVEYYLMDEVGFWRALRRALSDMKLLPARRN